MARVRKDSLVLKVVSALEGMIRSGEWGEYLPGLRVLKDHLGVSIPTVRKALDMLELDGWIELGGEKRRTKIIWKENGEEANVDTSGKDDRGVRKALLIVACKPIYQMGVSGRRVMDEFERRMVDEGWMVKFRSIPYKYAVKPHKSWDLILKGLEPEVVVCLSSRAVLGEWAAKHRLKLICCGGAVGDWPFPMIAVCSEVMLRKALRSLLEAGCKRIIYPMIGRIDTTVESLVGAMKEEFEKEDMVFSRKYSMPVIPVGDPTIYEEWLKNCISKGAPDAFLLGNEYEMAALLGVMMRLNLKVGEDLKVIVMGELGSLKWFKPEISCFRFPVRRIVRVLESACRLTLTGQQPQGELMEPQFLKGESFNKLSAGTGQRQVK